MIDRVKVEKAIYDLLVAIGEDVNREGLQQTPQRVARMYDEILSGMNSDARKHLKFFLEGSSNQGAVIVKDIPVYSLCEHHLLPFMGYVHIAYIPKDGKVIGLSKFSRIVDCFAKRLQVQERLTDQIAKFIYENVKPEGVAVIIEAEHLCMTMRGAKATGSKTRTTAFYGVLNEDKDKRIEIMNIIERGY